MAKLLPYSVKWAAPGDGEDIKAVLAADGGHSLLMGLDWQNVYQGWLLVLDARGFIVAVVNVIPGWPIGRIEQLCISPSIKGRDRAIIVRDLGECARSVLHNMGCQVINFNVDNKLVGWRQVLVNRGAQKYYEGTAYIMPSSLRSAKPAFASPSV